MSSATSSVCSSKPQLVGFHPHMCTSSSIHRPTTGVRARTHVSHDAQGPAAAAAASSSSSRKARAGDGDRRPLRTPTASRRRRPAPPPPPNSTKKPAAAPATAALDDDDDDRQARIRRGARGEDGDPGDQRQAHPGPRLQHGAPSFPPLSAFFRCPCLLLDRHPPPTIRTKPNQTTTRSSRRRAPRGPSSPRSARTRASPPAPPAASAWWSWRRARGPRR